METPGSHTPTLTWAVADVTEPITRPNAINPFRSTCFIFALSFGSPGPGHPRPRSTKGRRRSTEQSMAGDMRMPGRRDFQAPQSHARRSTCHRRCGSAHTDRMYYGEKFNAVSHLLGAVLALAGTVVLVVLAALGGDPWKVVGVSIYGASLVLMYSSSTLYHSVRGRRAKDFLRKMDHQSIYLLIAGSYTPFCLVTLRGPWGWSLLGVVWGLAVAGSLQDLRPRSEARILSVVIYLLMGWAALVALVPMVHALGRAGFAWVASGGVFYTVGIVFYALDARMKHAHGIWHLFVLAGSAAHFIAILLYVV